MSNQSESVAQLLRRPGLTPALVKDILENRKLTRTREQVDRSIPAVRQRCASSLYEFVKEAWPVLEPSTRFVPGWHVKAICDHLQAVTDGRITRLLINIPPGGMKSLLVSVFWPTWEWTACGLMATRYLCSSFREEAVARDCRRMRTLVSSEWCQRHWPEVELTRAGELSFENTMTGCRDGVSMASLTSRRADRLILDDPHSVEKAESDADRRRVVARFREGAVNRLNDQARSAIVVIMQRLHQNDVAGEIMDGAMGYECLVLPMEYESSRRCETSIGFADPRTRDGELLCPQRFSREVVDDLKRDMGMYAYAGQYQQRPAPRGGGILPYNGWEHWSKAEALKYGRNENQFPDMEVIVAGLDTAFTEKQQNDLSALVVLGVWSNMYGQLQVMVMHCWQARLKFADLVEKVVQSCRKMKVSRLLIEAGGAGLSVVQEIRRLTFDEEFAVVQINHVKEGDKEARAHSISELMGERDDAGNLVRKSLVWVPAVEQANGDSWPREWAEQLMASCVAGETLVVCAEGVIPASEVLPGMSVLTHKGRFRPVTAVSCREAPETVVIEGKSLEPLTLTPEHPLFAAWVSAERNWRAPDWIEAGKAETRRYREVERSGQMVSEAGPSSCHAVLLPAVQREAPIDEIDLLEFAALAGRDYAVMENLSGFVATSHSKSRVFQRGQRLDYEFGWLMGLYLAEGCASRRVIKWALNAAKEQHLAKRVATFCRDRFALEPRVTIRPPVVEISLSAALIAPFFQTCGSYAWDKRIADWMWDAPDEFLRGLLDGWAAGDGHVDRSDRIVVTTVSPSLAIGMRLVALRLGIPATALQTNPAGWMEIQGRRHRTRPKWIVTWRTDMANRGATLFMPEINDLPPYAAFSIMKRSVGPEAIEVYNFDVLEDHSYTTAGGVVHNCANFPKGKHDDLVDSYVMTMRYLRQRGLVRKPREHEVESTAALMAQPKGPPALYPT